MKLHKSLILQLGFIIVFVVTLILAALGVYQHRIDSQRLSARTQESLDMAVNRLSASLSLPLFTLYEEGINNVIFSELNDPLITGIYVELPWESQKNKYWYHKVDGIKKADKIPVNDGVLFASGIIKYQEEELGVVHVQITDEFIANELSAHTGGMAHQILIIDVILIVSLIFLLKVTIINPVNNLKNAAVMISEGGLGHRTDSKSSNELGELSRAFNKMAGDLERSNKQLTDYSKNLEQKVEKRTRDLHMQAKKLQQKNEELEKFNGMVVDRELKMIELKNKLKELENTNKRGRNT